MRRVISMCALSFCVGAIPAYAQNAKVKSETKVKADDAQVVSITGCLEGGPSVFLLSHAVIPKDQSKKVRKIVGTTGTADTYELTAQQGVELAESVGHQVQVTGVMIPAATASDKHTNIEVKQKTKVEAEHQPDQKTESKTKAEIAKTDYPMFSVVSVKDVSSSCAD